MGKKVSVVMTTYNGQKYLREQMDSLREQTMPIDEVIIMDDCSTDHTPDLVSAYIKEYDLKGWNLVQNEQNQGWKKNFKSGFDLATGNYIFPCDQDDIWHTLDDVPAELKKLNTVTDNLDVFFDAVDAVYIRSFPTKHYEQIKKALNSGKHVLCESPITLDKQKCKELFELAQSKGCILMEAIKTAYNTAFSRLVLLAKSGKIGDIISVDATCTSLKELSVNEVEKFIVWNSAFDWGPTAMLPVFEILGTNYKIKRIVTHYIDKERSFDDFTKIDFTYDNAVASIKVGMGVKSEGELIVSGTKGYIYVPAPWWKTDYFELRYENAADNRRYFYQLDGEGIRYELVAFVRAIENGRMARYIEEYVSEALSSVLSDFHNGIDVFAIKK